MIIMDAKTELILIRITGLDRPGLTASFTEILSGYDVTIMDIGQANIHSTLSLGILFKSPKADSGNIMKELLFKASDFGVNNQDTIKKSFIFILNSLSLKIDFIAFEIVC